MASMAALRMMEELRANKRPPMPLAKERAEQEVEAAARPLPEGTDLTPCVMGGVAAEWVRCGPVAERGLVLSLHGGGYRTGSLITHRGLAARISRRLGLRVLAIDYRLAPEHPFPAALEDAEAAYDALLAADNTASELVLFGDSAGGGLAISLMLALKQKKRPQPAGAVLLSPWTDLECTGPSYVANKASDPFMTRDGLLSAADDYRGARPPEYPMLSPIHADLCGLPPMLVQAGGGEIMLSDSVIFAERASAAGCEVTLDIEPEMWHVYPNALDDVPEAQAALQRIHGFIGKLMASA